jgi:GMP synthase (glutamine-hydrolysing)
MASRVLILDFGSQTTQLIARRVRELQVYCEILPCNVPAERLRAFEPDAIILGGGPASVHGVEPPRPDDAIWELGKPILGICYGMQLMVEREGGKVRPADKREFGHANLEKIGTTHLLADVPDEFPTWMSHGDQVLALPEGFRSTASTKTCPEAVVENDSKHWYGVQFHPEVVHTRDGPQILGNFLFAIAGLQADWQMGSFIDEKVSAIRQQVGDAQVIMGLSGGVDSSVAAALIHKAIGDQLHSVYVDHGLARKGEREQVEALFKDAFGMDLRVAEADKLFLEDLAGVTDPEEKRKRIGHRFIEVFDQQASSIEAELGEKVKFLGQGTLYPDVIESVSFHGGPTDVIKSHHNVGGLPEHMELDLVEPLRELFKDEVRELGHELGLPDYVIKRQPFPGPGLAIRILGDITAERLHLVRESDAIVREEIDAAIADGRVDRPLWQWFAVLLPVQSVGVMGDARTYEQTICVRCVESTDAMTADWAELPRDLLGRVANRIINEVRGVNRVVYDISSKPPATIEWE